LEKETEARSAIPQKDLGDLAKDVALIGSSAVPVGAAVKGAAMIPKVLRAAKVAEEAGDVEKAARLTRAAEKAAEDAQKASGAAKKAEAAGKSRKAGRLADRAERKTAKARVKRERAGMSRSERLKDRAQDVKTRGVARAQVSAHKALAGGGGAGAAALGAREATKKSGGKEIAKRVARGAVRGPGRASSRSVQAATAPAFLPVTGAVPSDQKALNLASAPVQLAEATVEVGPGKVAGASIKSARDMLLGTPAAIQKLVTDPAGAWDEMKADYAKRYGPLLESDEEALKKILADEGLTSYGLDALGVAGGTGGVVGRAARTGKLGKKAARLMNEERPGLQVPAGAKARRQKTSKNVFGAAGQRGLDRARRRKTESRSKGGREGGDAAARNAVEQGTVEPLFPNVARAKAVAGEKARTRLTNISQQGQINNKMAELLGTMSRDQQRAVKWALTLGVRTPDQARRELPARIRQIQEERGIDSDYGKLDNIPELERIIERADDIFTVEFGNNIGKMRRLEKRYAVGDPKKGAARKDPALDIEQAAIRRESQQAEHLIGRRAEDESIEEYRARYREALSESGLDEPGYFPSELSRRRRFSQAAVGGTRHSERPKAYKGDLFRKGIENTDPAVMVRGLQRNVKRSNAWDMVSNIMERNSMPWSRTADGQGMSMRELVEYMGKNGIDESSVTFVNPGMMRTQMADDVLKGRGEGGSGLGNADFTELQDAIMAGVRSKAGTQFEDMKGWLAVPNKVMDELEASMRTRLGGRVADLMMSKMSGYLLAFNTGWLGFQTISTAAQAAIAGVTPADWVLGQLFFHRMARENANTGARQGLTRRRAPGSSREIAGNADLDRLNSAVGISQAGNMQQMPHLGASAPDGRWISGAVEGYRIFREGKWGQAMRSTNPIQAWFRLSQIPESANRKALAYKLLKSAEVKRMNQNIKKTDAAMNSIMSHFKLDPEGQIRAAIKNPEKLEEMARGLADFLGDYQTFTAFERTWLKRSIPFYSWMRFATKFAFFTMPTKHPVMTSLVYQLGRLETDELRDVLGPGMDWALGKMFLGDPADPNTPFVDIYRGNPLLSGLVEFSSAKDIMSFVPPYIGILMNQAYGRDYFTRQDITVDGETQGRRFTEPGLLNSLEVAVGQYLRTFTPYRQLEEAVYAGTPQSSDAFPFAPEPKQYKPGSGSETRAREEEAFREQGGVPGMLYRRNLPFAPQDSRSLRESAEYINAETIRERESLSGESDDSDLSSYMDELKSEMESSSDVADYMKELKEAMGQ
jgi:hypothetical protein